MNPTQQALEKAIFENPDDLANHAAYADFLSQQGDPRGEFIQVQIRLEDERLAAAERKTLKTRERELLDQYADAWLGELRPFIHETDRSSTAYATGGAQMVRGWLDAVNITYLIPEVANAMVRSGEYYRLLRRLQIDGVFVESNDVASTMILLGLPPLPSLREFHYHNNDPIFRFIPDLDDGINDLLVKMPHISDLLIDSGGLNLPRFFESQLLPSLRRLELMTGSVFPLDLLAANSSLSCVTHLFFQPYPFQSVDENETSYLPWPQLRALIESKHLKSLTHLRLRLSDLGDEGCELLVRTGLLKQLRTLDIERGTITDVGARILAECPDTRNLEHLNISWNRLTPEGLGLLVRAEIAVKGYDQFDSEADDPMQHLFDEIME